MRAFVSLCGVLLVIATAIVSARGQEGVPLEESQLDNRLRALWRTTDAIETSGFVEEIDRLDLSAERRLEVMVQILDHPTVSVRVSAFHRIGQLGAAASSAAPRLLNALSGEDSERVAAIYALNEIAEPTPEIIQALLAIPADNQTDYVRLAMLRTFRGWGPKAQAAIPFAESLLDHESVDIQVEAFESLGRITNLARPSLDELKTIRFAELPPAAAHAALAALRDFGYEAAFLAPRVRDWHDLPATRRAVKLAILTTYPALRTLDSWYVPQLFAAWRETTDSTHDLLSRTIRKLDCEDAQAIQSLVVELSNPLEESSSLAAELLIRAGTNALPADAALAPLLEQVDGTNGTPNNQRLGHYLELVRAMGPHAQQSRAVLVKLLKRYSAMKDGQARGISSFLFVVLADGPMPREALPLVLDALQAPERAWPWAAAARAAGALGPAASEAAPLLVSALQLPPNYHVTIRVERFGMGRGHVNGDFTTTRLEAIRALGRIGPSASDALPALRTIADYQSPDFSRMKDSGYEGLENATRFVIPRLEAVAARAAIESIAPTPAK